MGRLLVELDALDRTLQAAHGHDLVGPASLHASFVHGGREMSSYPDRCQLQLERRIIPGESAGAGTREVSRIVDLLRARDPGFRATVRMMFAREPYALSPDHELPRLLLDVAARRGVESRAMGMSFWTDAAILGAAGIPSVLFGPSGGGLHSIDEWVDAQSVLACRDLLADAALRWCAG
jgi:acetylornithine deacetylase